MDVDDQVRRARRRLLGWAREHGRHFWWRDQRNPYVTAIVEILLKQTRAETVETVARDLLMRYPDPRTLAIASISQLEADLAPLGFHRQRAAHLKAFGTALTHEGKALSKDITRLLDLPGVGPYGASAIRCFVYGAREAVVDVNVVRIVERVFGISYPRGEGRKNKDVRRLADRLVSGQRPRQMNWALLDLGALVCRERNPRCEICPLQGVCVTRSQEIAA